MASLEESATKLDFRGLMIGSIITAFGLVVGLFWKDAITETVDQFVPAGQGLLYRYIVAIIVTVAIVLVIYILMKTTAISKKYEDKAKEKIVKEAQVHVKKFTEEKEKLMKEVQEGTQKLKKEKEKLVGKKLLKKG